MVVPVIPSSTKKIGVRVGAVLKVLLGLLQPTDVKDLMELCHHTSDVRGRKTAVFHSVDDIAPAGIVTPRLGKQSTLDRVLLHVVFLLDKKFGSATLISLARHKTAILSMTLRGGGGPEGQAASLSDCGSWPWGGLSPLRDAGVVRSFSFRRSHSAPAPGSPHYVSGPPLFSC